PVLYLSSSLSPPPLCLSVPSAAPPPDLPSSPTRRSSDLFCPIASVAYPPRAARGRRGAARSPPHRLPDGRRGGPRRVAPGRRERLDRRALLDRTRRRGPATGRAGTPHQGAHRGTARSRPRALRCAADAAATRG